MKQLILAICLLLGSLSYGQSQQVLVSGRVSDISGEVLPGANVTVSDTIGTSTDILGNYKLSLAPGIYQITVSYIGYEKIKKDIEVNAGGTIENIRLLPTAIQLSDLVVTLNQVDNVQRIANYDIKQRPLNNSQEILRMIPGLFIAQHAGGGKAEQIFLRGFDIDHGTDINLSVDGLPVNMVSHAHGQGYSDLHFLIPETIKNVNFNKGPYAADKGDFATAGYAEFQTFDALDKSSVKVEGGQFGTFRTVALIDLVSNDKTKENAYIAGEAFFSNGYFESPQNFSRFNLIGKYNRFLNENIKLTLSMSSFFSQWDASGQIPQRSIDSGMITRFGAIDDTEGGKTSRTNVNLKINQNIGNKAVFTNQVYFIDYDFNLVSNFTFFLNDPVNGDQITQGESRKVYGYTGSFLNEENLGPASLTSEFGGSIRYDDINDIRLSSTLNKKVILDDIARGDVNQANIGLWTNQTVEFGNSLAINGSLRYDYFVFAYDNQLSNDGNRQVGEGVLSPKVQLNYKFNDRLSLFSKAGIGFHSNDARVVVERNGSEVLPKAYAFDAGFVYKPHPNLYINTTLWTLNLDQEFVYVGDEGIVEPSGKTKRQGVDVSARYQISNKLYVDTDFTYTNAKSLDVSDGNDRIPLAPEVTSIGGVSYQWKNGLGASIRYRYLGPRPANEDYSVTAEGYFLVDAILNYKRNKLELNLSVENVFNEEWKEAQFLTESRLRAERQSVSEIHFTPGTPLFVKVGVQISL